MLRIMFYDFRLFYEFLMFRLSPMFPFVLVAWFLFGFRFVLEFPLRRKEGYIRRTGFELDSFLPHLAIQFPPGPMFPPSPSK